MGCGVGFTQDAGLYRRLCPMGMPIMWALQPHHTAAWTREAEGWVGGRGQELGRAMLPQTRGKGPERWGHGQAELCSEGMGAL